MDHAQYQKTRILNLMDRIEDKTGQMMHVAFPQVFAMYVLWSDGRFAAAGLIERLNKIIDSMA